ncbi:hypothetical protein LXL04_034594 [Taraxacum kok-saghyz]
MLNSVSNAADLDHLLLWKTDFNFVNASSVVVSVSNIGTSNIGTRMSRKTSLLIHCRDLLRTHIFPRTPKPLTFSKNRLRGAKNRSNTSPVAKKNSEKTIFFYKNFEYVQKKIAHMHIFTNYIDYEHFGGSRSRFFEINNGLGDVGNWGSSRTMILHLKMRKNGAKGMTVEGRLVRSISRKDKNSKICTSKGARDRRIRLSANTAIQFYDVQDRLGCDRPSNAIDWLMKEAKIAIDVLNAEHYHPSEALHRTPGDRNQLNLNHNISNGSNNYPFEAIHPTTTHFAWNTTYNAGEDFGFMNRERLHSNFHPPFDHTPNNEFKNDDDGLLAFFRQKEMTESLIIWDEEKRKAVRSNAFSFGGPRRKPRGGPRRKPEALNDNKIEIIIKSEETHHPHPRNRHHLQQTPLHHRYPRQPN